MHSPEQLVRGTSLQETLVTKVSSFLNPLLILSAEKWAVTGWRHKSFIRKQVTKLKHFGVVASSSSKLYIKTKMEHTCKATHTVKVGHNDSTLSNNALWPLKGGSNKTSVIMRLAEHTDIKIVTILFREKLFQISFKWRKRRWWPQAACSILR